MSSASRIACWPPALLLAPALVACVSATTVPPPSEGLRSAMRQMEVRVIHASVAPAPSRPISGAGEGAAVGAARGAAGSVAVGAQFCQDPFSCVLGLAVGVAVAPFAGAVGAAVGGAKAHDAEEVTAAHERLTRAASEIDPVRSLQDAFAVAQPRLGPEPAASGSEPPVRLDIAIEHFGLASEGDYEPDVWLAMTVSARLLRSTDDEELYWRLWAYDGPKLPYFSLANGAPDSLNNLVLKASQTVADRVLFDLLHSASTEVLNRDARPIATIAAKYMQYGSELREYDRTDRAVYWPLNAHAGRPARWPDLPAEEPAPAPLPASADLRETAAPLPAPALAASPATPADELDHPAAVASPPRADGVWVATTSKWDVRLIVEGTHFEGSAHCLPRNLRYPIEGRVAADGTIEGSVKRGRATVQPVSTHMRGRWPTVVLPAATHCREEALTLTPS
jgi:hypothetical protein